MVRNMSWRTLLRPKVLLGLVLLGGGSLFAVWFYRYNQAPAVGEVHASVTTDKPAAPAQELSHFKGATIAFDYPSDYTTLESKPAVQPPVTELYIMNHSDPATGSKQLAVTVKSLSAGTMLEDAAFKFRQTQAQTYETGDAALPRYAAKKTVRRDGTEVTYFIPGEKAYVIIAATTNRPTDSFEPEITKLAESFVWR